MDRSIEMRPVVPFRAEHDLRVHGDARASQALHDRHQQALGPRLAQQPVAQLRVGGVDRDIERGQSLRLDSVELRLVQIRQRDVVAVQAGEPEVVVLDIQALAHPSRQLVDEAEHALVGAGRDLGRPRRLELEPQLWPAPPEHGRAPTPAGGLICLSPWMMYWSPEVTVKAAVTQAKSFGKAWSAPK